MEQRVEIGEDGRNRCWWGLSPPLYLDYHDREWGRPVIDDQRLLEKLCLEGFQAGLSWLTILRKRDAFREAFLGFDPEQMAALGPEDVERLLTNPGIVRHRGKIEAAINNARQTLRIVEEHRSLARYLWQFALPSGPPPAEVPDTTPRARELARALKAAGFRFVGPTTVYAFMQAMGLVNDHLDGCFVRAACEEERRPAMEKFLAT
jgi:DNA-3-methyladenine glycosylase I